MSLMQCHVPTHSTYQMLKQAGISKLGDVWHVGAAHGLEADIYDSLGATRVRWFECNPVLYAKLRDRIKYRFNHFSHQVALWKEDGHTLDFHLYKDLGASSFFEEDQMNQYVDCPPTGETIKLKTTTLDKMIEDLGWTDNVELAVFDIQGAELNAFKGAYRMFNMPALKYIISEVSWGPVYKGACTMEEVDEYLYTYGFTKLFVRKDWELHGDAFYARVN